MKDSILTLIDAVQDYKDARTDFHDFESENPYDASSRWDRVFDDMNYARDAMFLALKDVQFDINTGEEDQYLRDVGTDEDPCWVPACKGDPGAVRFVRDED